MAISITRSQGRAHGQSGQAFSPLCAGGGAGCQTGGAPHAATYGHHALGAGRCGPAHSEADQRSQESEHG